MKQIKKVIAILLTVCFLPLFVACNNILKKDENSADTTNNAIVHLQNFESYRTMFNCGFELFFGKVDLTKEHVVEGETSARVDIQTLETAGSVPYIHIDAKRKDMNYDLSDLSMIEYIGFYIYNDNDFDSTINFTAKGESKSTLLTKFCDIPAHEGRTFRFKIDRASQKIKGEAVKEYIFTLQNSTGVWYFDNIYAETAAAEIVLPTKQFVSDEILNFNTIDELGFVNGDSSFNSSRWITDLQIADVKGIAKNGSVLKLSLTEKVVDNVNEATKPKLYFTGFTMCDDFYKTFDYEKFIEKDFAVDVYSTYKSPVRFAICVKDTNSAYYYKYFTVQPNEWQTLKLSLEDIQSGPIVTYVGEKIMIGDGAIDLEMISKISVYVEYMYIDEDCEFYFDNVRMVNE